jgi:hypothetical protein
LKLAQEINSEINTRLFHPKFGLIPYSSLRMHGNI